MKGAGNSADKADEAAGDNFGFLAVDFFGGAMSTVEQQPLVTVKGESEDLMGLDSTTTHEQCICCIKYME